MPVYPHKDAVEKLIEEEIKRVSEIEHKGTPEERAAVRAKIEEEVALETLRNTLLEMMSDWSESHYAAGWMSGTEEKLHAQGGVWEILGRAIGWPSGYEGDADFRWLTWEEAGVLFAERKAL